MKEVVQRNEVVKTVEKKKTSSFRFLDLFKYTALSIISFISIFPFVWMILGMTNTAIDISGGKLKIGDNLIVNFQNLFSNDLNFMRSLGNSAMIAVVTTVFALLRFIKVSEKKKYSIFCFYR